MRIDIVTLFPEMIHAAGSHGIIGRAENRGVFELATWNPRDYSTDRHRTVDDRPYGGGPGMLMKFEPLRAAIQAAKAAAGEGTPVVYLSPQGRRLEQTSVKSLAQSAGVILVAGRYEGIDERLIDLEIDAEWSIGDYVLSGGELAALVIVDAVVRLLPGAVGDAASVQQDSFMDGLLDYPHYTRPADVDGRTVPEVLLQGDHQAIATWRRKQALGRTWQRRPDLLEQQTLNERDIELLNEFKREVTESTREDSQHE